MRSISFTKRLGLGLLPVAACFCLLSAVVAFSLTKILTGLFSFMEVEEEQNYAQAQLENKVAYLRLVDYGKLTEQKRQPIAGTDFEEEIILGPETPMEEFNGLVGCVYRMLTINIYKGKAVRPQATLAIQRSEGRESGTPIVKKPQCPIGTVTYWAGPLDKLPKDGGSVWLPCDGSNFDPYVYPELNLLLRKDHPERRGVLPDYRGAFLRGADYYYGVKTYMEIWPDAINNTEGHFWTYMPCSVFHYSLAVRGIPNQWSDYTTGWSDFDQSNSIFYNHVYDDPDRYSPTGNLKVGKMQPVYLHYNHSNRNENWYYSCKIGLDTSKMVRTAEENRPLNKAVHYIIKAK